MKTWTGSDARPARRASIHWWTAPTEEFREEVLTVLKRAMPDFGQVLRARSGSGA